MSEAHTEAYAASKGGLVALTHAMSISLATDVRVNCISPGWIFNEGVPPRTRTTRSIPPAASARRTTLRHWSRFLAGSESEFITGAEFIVDGGVTRKMIYPE